MTDRTYQVDLTGNEVAAISALIQVGVPQLAEHVFEDETIAELVSAGLTARAKLKEATA